MVRRKKLIIFFLIFITLLIALFFVNFFSKKNNITKENLLKNELEQKNYNANIIKDVNYESKDARGNEYIIDATEGQIDISNSDIIFLTDVKAIIKMNNSKDVVITSRSEEHTSNSSHAA